MEVVREADALEEAVSPPASQDTLADLSLYPFVFGSDIVEHSQRPYLFALFTRAIRLSACAQTWRFLQVGRC